MTIPFKQIPANIRVPLFYAEIDPSHANTASQVQRALLIGQIGAGSTLTPNVPVLSLSVADARAAAGQGSILAQMAYAYRQNDGFGEVWLLPLSDDAAATAAAGSVSFTGPATASGTLCLYIGGQLVSVAVTAAMTATQLATATIAAITALPNLAVAAVADETNAYQVNLTAKNKGLAGNDIDIRINYLGASGGQTTPTGIAVTIVPMASGATNPVLTTALANLEDMPFDFIVSAYNDPTSTTTISALLNDATGRWSWSTQVFGHCFIAKRGASGALATFGNGLNDQHLSCIGIYDSPTPTWNWAAATAAAAAVSLRADPGVPLQTVAINGVLAPPMVSRFTLSMRNTLLFDGISTYRVDASGTVSIENLITTYQRNGLGQVDDSYLEIETLFLLMFVLRRLAAVINTKYARVKLAADGTRLAPGTNVVTPLMIRADLIAQYRQMESEGFVQQSGAFAQGIVVEKNATNPNRVDVLYPAILIDQLRVFALLAQFRLS